MNSDLSQKLIRKALERGEVVRVTLAAAAGTLNLNTPGRQLNDEHAAASSAAIALGTVDAH